MEIIHKQFKTKKFLRPQIKICINCGSKKISANQFTIQCMDCSALNFYEAIWWAQAVKEFVFNSKVKKSQMVKSITWVIKDVHIASCSYKQIRLDVHVVVLSYEQNLEINSK